MNIQIAIVEDQLETRNNLEEYFELMQGFDCALAVGSAEAFFEQVKHPPEIVLMDIGLPGMSGIEGTRRICDQFPSCNVVILTISNEPEQIFEALRAGASGYLLKGTSLTELERFLKMLKQGGAPMSPQIARLVVDFFHGARKRTKHKSSLTQREYQVVDALLNGMSYKEAAYALNISIGTFTTHIKNIYRKLQVNSKAELFRKSYDGAL